METTHPSFSSLKDLGEEKERTKIFRDLGEITASDNRHYWVRRSNSLIQYKAALNDCSNDHLGWMDDLTCQAILDLVQITYQTNTE